MYVAVKGGEAAIANAHRLLAARRRGDTSVPGLTLEQIAGHPSGDFFVMGTTTSHGSR